MSYFFVVFCWGIEPSRILSSIRFLLKLFHRVCNVHIHHTNIIFRGDYRRVALVFLIFFLRLKYQKNMAPKKSKVKKPKVKKRVAQPAKSVIERTFCTHPMLKRVQKEVSELKKKSVKSIKNN